MTWEEKIKEIRGGCEKATPGPWTCFDRGPWGGLGAGVKVSENIADWFCTQGPTNHVKANNGFFIANSRTDIPLLLLRVEELTEALERVLREADRRTNNFDNARAVLNKTPNEEPG